MRDCKETNYGQRSGFLKPTGLSSFIAWRSGCRAVVFIAEPPCELLLCKLFNNLTPIAHAPFVFEIIYVTFVPFWPHLGSPCCRAPTYVDPPVAEIAIFPETAHCMRGNFWRLRLMSLSFRIHKAITIFVVYTRSQ